MSEIELFVVFMIAFGAATFLVLAALRGNRR